MTVRQTAPGSSGGAAPPAPLPTPPALQSLSVEEKRRLLTELLQRKAAQPQHHQPSLAQERLWFLHQLDHQSAQYNMLIAWRLTGNLVVTAFQQSLQEIVRRHAVLRTTFKADAAGMPMAVVAPSVEVQFVVEERSGLDDAALEQLLTAEIDSSFDLTKGPLFRARLLKVAPAAHIVIWKVHHILFDGYSGNLWLQELTTLYNAFVQGRPAALPALPLSYYDYAQQQRAQLAGAQLQPLLAYWQTALAGAPPLLELPTDHPRPALPSRRGQVLPIRLEATVFQALRELSRQTGVTLFVTLQAAFLVLLARYSRQRDLVIATAVANRTRLELEPLMGFLVDTVALRHQVADELSFRELLPRVQQTTRQALAHQALPFEKLVTLLQPERTLSHAPIAQVTFSFVPTGNSTAPSLTGLTISSVEWQRTTAKFDLGLLMAEDQGELWGQWEYNTDLFEAATIKRMAGHYQTLLASIIANPDQRIGDLPLLTAAERYQLLVEWPTRSVDGEAKTIHQLFEEQAARTPNALAVVMPGKQRTEDRRQRTEDGDRETGEGGLVGGQSLTYAELNVRANQLAHQLRALGIGPEMIVGVCLERSLDWVISFLAILKAGGAYLPLDPTYPQERLAFMLEDAAPSVIVTHSRHRGLFPATRAVRCYDTDAPLLAQQPTANPISGVKPDNLAYIIYTSGSTGKPKGVLNEHRGVAKLAPDQVAIFGLQSTSRLLQVVSLNFDVSISDLVTTLCAGAALVLAPPDMPIAADSLTRLINEQGITHFGMVPTLMAKMNPAALPTLQTVMVGGEPCPSELVRRWSGGYRFLNLYGPTEASICTTIMDYRAYTAASPNQPPPIGCAVADKQLYVLDANQQLAPIGVPGELYIGGPGLARGYLNQPALTAETFIANPFAGPGDSASSRLYKTGDLVRWLPPAPNRLPNLEFLGRIDQQVKIRGFRIEIGEIEALLNEHPALQAAVVVVQEARGEKRLVAYVVVKEHGVGSKEQIATRLRAYLKQKLPDYMIPAFFVQLDAFPRTANDKVDRNALPPPDLGQRATALVAPRDPFEHELAAIWQQVLDNPAVGIHDNFFELGGQSLLAVQLIAYVQKALGRELPVALLFQAPTIAELATVLRQQQTTPAWSPLVAIQPRGAKPPLFCMPGMGGQVFGFYALARCLGPDQPLYGLQMRGLDGRAAPHTTIEAMAADYVAAIREIQPRGPYHLLGQSLGGMVAFEMAQQLCRAGETVAPLLILDMFAPPFLPEVEAAHADDPRWWSTLAEYLGALSNTTVNLATDLLAQQTPDEQLAHFQQALEAAHLLPVGSDLQQVRGMAAVFRANQLLAYTPQATTPVPICLLQATERNAVRESAYPQEPTWGWSRYANSALTVSETPGDHFTMLIEPNVQTLVQKLLDRQAVHVTLQN